MSISKKIFNITTLILLSVASCNGRSQIEYIESSEPDIHVQRNVKIAQPLEPLRDFYSELSKKFPKEKQLLNVEEAYHIKVMPSNAADVLALAIIVGGEAPQADKLFKAYYDPWMKCSESGDIILPETEEAADFRADLIIGLQQQWPTLIEAIKIKNAVQKSPKDDLKRSIFIDGIKVRLRINLDNMLTLTSPKAEPAVVIAPSSRKRPFVERKDTWQAKRRAIALTSKQRTQP